MDWENVYFHEMGTLFDTNALFPYQVSVKSSLTLTLNHPDRIVAEFKVPAMNEETAWNEHWETVTLVKNSHGFVIDSQTASPLIGGFTQAEMEAYVNHLYGSYVGSPLHFRFADDRDYVFSGTNLQGQTFTFRANKQTGLVTQFSF